MTDEQVQIAIEVLKAYAAGTLQTDLCDDLDEALDAAWQVYAADRFDGNNYD